jgi:hypothetical protein
MTKESCKIKRHQPSEQCKIRGNASFSPHCQDEEQKDRQTDGRQKANNELENQSLCI